MRAFVSLREMAVNYRNLSSKLGELERRCNHQDQNIKVVFDALKRLIHAPEPPRRPIGFVAAHRPPVA